MKLLVALDLSDCTETIVKQVEEIAKPLSASVWIIHNAKPKPDALEFKTDPIAARESLAKKFHQEHLQIQEIAENLRSEGLKVTAFLVHDGSTAKTVLEEAEKLDVNMIIVGSHGRGAAYQLILGSVSAGVIHKARCPVLVIPTRNHADDSASSVVSSG